MMACTNTLTPYENSHRIKPSVVAELTQQISRNYLTWADTVKSGWVGWKGRFDWVDRTALFISSVEPSCEFA